MRSIILLLAVAALALAGCSGQPTAPTDVSPTSATLKADASVAEGDSPLSWWWQIATSEAEIGAPNPSGPTSRCLGGPANIPPGNYPGLACPVSELTPNTSYHYKICADTAQLPPVCSSATQQFTTAPEPDVIAENITGIAQFFYRIGGTAIPDGTCDATCTALLVGHRAPPPPGADPVVTELVERELVGIGEGTGTWPSWKVIKAGIGRFTLGGASFGAGLWVGDVLNDKFLHIGGPPAPAAPAEMNYTSFALVWLTQGTYLGDASAYAPQDGLYLEAQPNYQHTFKRWSGSNQGSCSNLDPMPSDYLDFNVGQDACASGPGEISWRDLHAYVLHAYVYDADFEILGPIEDYDGQPYDFRIGDWPGEPPSMAELQARVEQVLESGEVPNGERELKHNLEPDNYPHPSITEEENNHRCDRSPGARYSNPLNSSSPAPFVKRIAQPFNVTIRPAGYGDTKVFLHEGRAHWRPGKNPDISPQYIDDWGGWGYRHIKAAHGWSPADLAETITALNNGIPLPQDTPSKFRYDYPVGPGLGGVSCTRRVVIDFKAGQREGEPPDPQPRGIVTSFNVVG